MGLPLVINGTSYLYPETGDVNWGSQATLWASAVTVGMLQKAGGSFTLASEVDFGPTYGLKTAYYKTETANPASSGQVRLAKTDSIDFRNNANSGDLALAINGSDVLTFNGEVIPAGLIVNADIDIAAAIAFSKMAALSNSILPVTNSSGVITSSPVTATEAGYLSGVTSAIQTQINTKAALAGATFTGSVLLNADPTVALQAATKSYVDGLATGLNAKTACRIATTANGTLSTAFANGQTIDGVTIATNDRILIKNQSTQADNGIYVVQASGAPVRATDANTWAQLVGAYVFISAGTANTATSWVCNVAAGGTIGVTAVTFVQFSASQAYTASGTGIVLSGNEFDLQLDSSTLSQSGSGVKVATGGITNTQINASAAIALSKLAATTASKALVSDGSGFISASSVTSTTLAFLDATSSVQTQLDAKIAKTLLSSTNDMIYASSANTPARLAAGTDGYILESASGVPTWTNPKTSFSILSVPIGTVSIGTTFSILTLPAVTSSVGTAISISSSVITFPFAGTWEIILEFSNVASGSTSRTVLGKVIDTSNGNALINNMTVGNSTQPNNSLGMTFVLTSVVTNASHTHEIHFAASGSGVAMSPSTVNGLSTRTWTGSFRYINI